jgi:hypothetical protein
VAKKSKYDDGGNAYPIPGLPQTALAQGMLPAKPGMSLEDHFAGLAMKSIMEIVMELVVEQHGIDQDIPDRLVDMAVRNSYKVARGMLNERKMLRSEK